MNDECDYDIVAFVVVDCVGDGGYNIFCNCSIGNIDVLVLRISFGMFEPCECWC